ncbi:hypothetical protein [Nostoc sp.]
MDNLFEAIAYTNFKNDCDKWTEKTQIHQAVSNPKSKIQNGIT